LAKVPAAELFATDFVVVHAHTNVRILASADSLAGAAPSGIVAVVVLVAHAACPRARLLVLPSQGHGSHHSFGLR